jgi:hypothetical protein
MLSLFYMHSRATYHPVHYLEQKVSQVFPNLESVVCLYKKESELKVSIDGSVVALQVVELPAVQKWRSKSVSYSWMRPADFPWIDNTDLHSTQLHMLDEHENRLLILCFVSPVDHLKDIVALSFPRNTKFFGLQKDLQDFTTDEKVIVGEMLHKLLGFEYQQAIQERESLLRMQRFQQLKAEKQVQSAQKEAAFEKFFVQTCAALLQELNLSGSVTFEIEADASNYLAEKCTHADDLRAFLQEAMELAVMLDPMAAKLSLTLEHFETVRETLTVTAAQPTQEQRVLDLLSRYEEAAVLAFRQGHAVNGKSVAQFLQPPVSPPAISESLKKHAVKIEKLLKEYPFEWKLIRSSLKPLRESDRFNDLKLNRLG